MRATVIGGGGFIGRHVVDRLIEHGVAVTVLNRGDAPRPTCDLAIHMFAMTAADGQAFARQYGSKLVVISSGDVYRAYGRLLGTEPGAYELTPLTETSPLRNVLFPYSAQPEYDKIPIEREVMRTGRGWVLRLPAVFGIGDKHHRLGAWLKRMRPTDLEFVMGESYAAWRWTHGYVENVAEAIALAAIDPRSTGGIYNVGEADTPTMFERVRRMAEASGWTGRVSIVPDDQLPEDLKLPYDLKQHMVMDTSRIRNELGYREVVSEAEGIRRTVPWELAG
jgi:nucleoside-diphosphate-sugar epimerase